MMEKFEEMIQGNVPTLVDYFATWCGPCKYQIPHLMRLEEEFEGRGIVFVSLSVDKPADTQKWKDMVKEFGMKGIWGLPRMHSITHSSRSIK